MDLNGKTALVTGAGRGFGWGIARAMAQAGARVCASDIDDTDIARVVAEIEKEEGTAYGRHLDAADLDSFQTVVEELIGRWGRLDILVHCAIYMPLLTFEKTTAKSWKRQLQVSLGGLYNATRTAWEIMKRQGGGHIIGIASGSSLRGYREEVAYCTAKHAQEGFVKALALEAIPYGISINTVGPGKPIKTTRVTWEELAALPAEVKSGWADPTDLGRAFVWLAGQPPGRFSGLRFDAGPIVDTLDAEGEDFVFTAEKVTLYPEDFRARQAWMRDYPD